MGAGGRGPDGVHERAMAVHGKNTVGNKRSWDAAMTAAGAVLEAVDRVLHGETHNAFCAVRPPGHHAGVELHCMGAVSNGFCILNNVALAAVYAHHCGYLPGTWAGWLWWGSTFTTATAPRMSCAGQSTRASCAPPSTPSTAARARTRPKPRSFPGQARRERPTTTSLTSLWGIRFTARASCTALSEPSITIDWPPGRAGLIHIVFFVLLTSTRHAGNSADTAIVSVCYVFLYAVVQRSGRRFSGTAVSVLGFPGSNN